MTKWKHFGVAMLLICSPLLSQQVKVHTLTEQELLDMMQGSTLQSSRASDTPVTITQIKAALAAGKTFQMVELQDVPDDWMTVTPGGVGADASAWQDVIDRAKHDKYPVITDGSVRAAQMLSAYIGHPFNAVVREEGAGATLSALLMAANLNLPVVDACMTGRSRPELEDQLASAMGVPAYPAAYVTRWGDTMLLTHAVNDYRVEDLARALGVASGGGVAGAMDPMTGKDAKRVLIPGMLTQAIAIGKAIREANEQHKDPVVAILKTVHGYKLFHGIVYSDKTEGGDRGFTYSDITVRGMEEDLGHTYRLYVKNENVVAWRDGVPDATAPDNIQNVDPKTGDAPWLLLGALKVGSEVVMLGWPNDPRWHTPEAVALFGPRHFGFDFDYVPIEELQQRRNNPRY